MPRGNGTGPAGRGPLTGRRAGFCAGIGAPGYANNYKGGGRRFGRSRGWNGFASGWGGRGGVPLPVDFPTGTVDEATALINQARFFKEHLKAVEARIQELKAGTEESNQTGG